MFIYSFFVCTSFGSNINIVVNTVDSFQGKEKEIVIMSCVRSDPNNFLGDEKRLNVALTRAKTALYIIGANSLFSVSNRLVVGGCFYVMIFSEMLYFEQSERRRGKEKFEFRSAWRADRQ